MLSLAIDCPFLNWRQALWDVLDLCSARAFQNEIQQLLAVGVQRASLGRFIGLCQVCQNHSKFVCLPELPGLGSSVLRYYRTRRLYELHASLEDFAQAGGVQIRTLAACLGSQ